MPFEYIIEVTNITPNRGSINGGVVLTLTGKNFSTHPNKNQVFIGERSDQMCTVQSVNAQGTEMTALCPPKATNNDDIQWIDGAGKIIDSNKVNVYGRIIEKAVTNCSGTCTFDYDQGITPSIPDTADQTYRKGQVVSITGGSRL